MRTALTVTTLVALTALFGCEDDPQMETNGLPQTAEESEVDPAHPAQRQDEVDYGVLQDKEPVAGKVMEDKRDRAQELARKAAGTLERMKADPELAKLLSRVAGGVLLVPEYTRAALGVGGRGGEAVMIVNDDGHWRGPAFFDLGGVSFGAQAGVETGEMAILFMRDQQMDSFRKEDVFTLDASAKLTMADYSEVAKATAGSVDTEDPDVIFWSGTDGAFAGATLGATNISWHDRANLAYYGRETNPGEVFRGGLTPPQDELQRALSAL